MSSFVDSKEGGVEWSEEWSVDAMLGYSVSFRNTVSDCGECHISKSYKKKKIVVLSFFTVAQPRNNFVFYIAGSGHILGLRGGLSPGRDPMCARLLTGCTGIILREK
jgi:hypothetical protein